MSRRWSVRLTPKGRSEYNKLDTARRAIVDAAMTTLATDPYAVGTPFNANEPDIRYLAQPTVTVTYVIEHRLIWVHVTGAQATGHPSAGR